MSVSTDQLIDVFQGTLMALVRLDGPDLTARQLSVFLTCYLQEGPHTVRGLAAELNVVKPAITRVFDRLSELDLARRKRDPLDGRSVLLQRTMRGATFLRDLRLILKEASSTAAKAQPANKPVHRIQAEQVVAWPDLGQA